MSVQKLHALEKTSIQLRHTMKRLEVFVDIAHSELEKGIAQDILNKIKEARKLIPEHYQDVDVKDKE